MLSLSLLRKNNNLYNARKNDNLYTAPENGQVIGALQGMEIGDSTTTMVDQEKETRVESDVQGDDLLGEDLEAMEEGKILLQNEWFILLLQRVKN